MGLDLSSLTGLTSQLGSLIPTPDAVLQSIAVSAASGIALAGIKAQVAGGAIPDPLHLFTSQNNNQPPAPTNNPNVMVGPTITATAFGQLPPAAQASLMAAGAHIVAG